MNSFESPLGSFIFLHTHFDFSYILYLFKLYIAINIQFVDCANHALRIGYYASPQCGSLHTLTDSDSKPNAAYARLNHPSTYISNGQTKYYEYSAGSHLSIKLSRHAKVYAVALQGSPNALRYYLKSFQMASKIRVQSLNVNQQPTTNEDYYKENGITKVLLVKLKIALDKVICKKSTHLLGEARVQFHLNTQ